MLYTTRNHPEEDETFLNSTAPSLVDFQVNYRSFTVRQLREEIKSKGLGQKEQAKTKKAALLHLLFLLLQKLDTPRLNLATRLHDAFDAILNFELIF